jgi:type I restriction enzyme R subunit
LYLQCITQTLCDIHATQEYLFSLLSISTVQSLYVDRVSSAKSNIYNFVNDKQRDFIDFILRNYIKDGEDELELSKLPIAINLKYGSISGAEVNLGSIKEIKKVFIDFQKYLYLEQVA